MKKLKIKGNNINNLFIAMNIFNLHELVKIEYSYDYENKKHIITAAYGLLRSAALKNRIEAINLMTDEKLEFETKEI